MIKLGERTATLELPGVVSGQAVVGTKESIHFRLIHQKNGLVVVEAQEHPHLQLSRELRDRKFSQGEFVRMSSSLSDCQFKVINGELRFHPRLRGGLPVLAGLLTQEVVGAIMAGILQAASMSGKAALQGTGATIKFVNNNQQEIKGTAQIGRDFTLSILKLVSEGIVILNGGLLKSLGGLFAECGNGMGALLSPVVNKVTASVADNLEGIVRKTSVEVKKRVGQTSREVHGVIDKTSEELQKTVLVSSSEVRKILDQALEGVVNLYQDLAKELDKKIALVGDQAKGLVDKTGTEARQTITHALTEAENTFKTLCTKISSEVNTTIDHTANRVEGIVITTREQGQILIHDTGREVRTTFDHIFASRYRGAEALVEVAGQQVALIIQDVGIELRSTLRELPKIMEGVGRAVAEGASSVLEEKLRLIAGYETDIVIVKNGLKGYLLSPDSDIRTAISYIQEQDNLSPPQKVAVYKAFIDAINRPEIKNRGMFFIMIGVAALADPHLQQLYNPSNTKLDWLKSFFFGQQEDPRETLSALWSFGEANDPDEEANSGWIPWFRQGKDPVVLTYTYSQLLISKIPRKEEKLQLVQLGPKAIEPYLPKPVLPERQEIDFADLYRKEKEKREEKELELGARVEELEIELGLLSKQLEATTATLKARDENLTKLYAQLRTKGIYDIH